MNLLIVRHGHAIDKAFDHERPLSEQGIEQVENLASELLRLNISFQEIHHSTLLRAKQTAQILKEELHLNTRMYESSNLLPNIDPSLIYDAITMSEKSQIIVGHMPFMSLLASLLLPKEHNDFPTAGAILLKRSDINHNFEFAWKNF